MPTRKGKVSFNMCYYILKNGVIILLERNHKCKSDQNPTSQEGRDNKSNHSEKAKSPLEEANKVT
jgi:hypothetical protein